MTPQSLNSSAPRELRRPRDHVSVFRAFLRVLERLAPRCQRGGAPLSAGVIREKP